MHFIDRINLFEVSEKTEGKNWKRDTSTKYLHIRATVARCGVLKYPERGYNTYIPQEVIARDCKGLEDKPVVSILEENDHKAPDTDSTNTRYRGRGWVKAGSVTFDGEWVHCWVVISDEKLIKAILGGTLTALSCGYDVKWRNEPGKHNGEVYQWIITEIIYNHLAVVDIGRAGPDCRLHTDRKEGMTAKLLKTLTLRAIQSGKLNLSQQHVTLHVDRPEDGFTIEDRVNQMTDRITEQDQEIERLQTENEGLKGKVEAANEQQKQMTDQQSNMVPLDKVDEVAEKIVDCRETCTLLGIGITDKRNPHQTTDASGQPLVNSKDPVAMMLAVCDRALPQSAKKFRTDFADQLKTGKLTDQALTKLDAIYESAKEQRGYASDVSQVVDMMTGQAVTNPAGAGGYQPFYGPVEPHLPGPGTGMADGFGGPVNGSGRRTQNPANDPEAYLHNTLYKQ